LVKNGGAVWALMSLTRIRERKVKAKNKLKKKIMEK
jgi:hypothetical protein